MILEWNIFDHDALEGGFHSPGATPTMDDQSRGSPMTRETTILT